MKILYLFTLALFGYIRAVKTRAPAPEYPQNEPTTIKQWTPEEDATLLALVRASTSLPDWSTIAHHLNTSTRKTQDHYHSRLDPILRAPMRGRWSRKDDLQILEFVDAAISLGRTPKWTALGRLMRIPRHTIKARYGTLKVLERSGSRGSLSSLETEDTLDTVGSGGIDEDMYLDGDEVLLFTFEDVPDFDEWMAMHIRNTHARDDMADGLDTESGDDLAVDPSDFDDLSSLLTSDEV